MNKYSVYLNKKQHLPSITEKYDRIELGNEGIFYKINQYSCKDAAWLALKTAF